ELIAFAPEYKQLRTGGGGGLSLLPNSGNEAKEVTAVFGGKAYLGEDATKPRFLKEALDYRIIHLAMHTWINDSLPMFSELLFYEDAGKASSGKLYTYEVFGLKLAAELVVLSACNTGSGRLQKGEGIMSLARGFKYAGVPSIILTLWEVQDKATSGIMKQFYLYLKEGDSKDVALQKAKLDFLDNANRLKSHPYYWSSFLITGDAEQIVKNEEGSNSMQLIYSGIALFVLLLGVALFWKIKERKKT
ncbi:MAG: CHAT domain-containing protein, partial [Bacteroidales bacterium]|nr:CHAT domain-containing protein [Bacteroidales bacterium]